MNKSHLLINEPALQVLPSLAQIIGLDEAIVIQQLHYWLNNSKSEGRIDENGEKWVYNTYAEWKENNFPFWSEDKIQRIFLSLEKQGVVISAQLDAKKRDMRKFYRIAYDKLCAMDDSFLRPSNDAKSHDVKMNQKLPETTTEIAAKPLPSKKDAVDFEIDFHLKPKAIKDAFVKFFQLTPNWETKYNRQIMQFLLEQNATPEQVEFAADLWRKDKRFNWAAPSLKGVQEHWLELIQDLQRPQKLSLLEQIQYDLMKAQQGSSHA
jgi:hypothetical protein